MRELSYRIDLGDNQSFTLGRHLLRWSELDRRWNFGLIEPEFKWNPLAPETQGLSGLFWDVKTDDFRFGLFASVLYIPNQGPSYSLDGNGQFAQGNPFFQTPPTSINIFGVSSPIEYQIDRPSDSQIITQTSYGAHLDLGDDTPYRARLAGVYAPMNELALGYNGALDLSTNRAVVNIQPQVVFHQVLSADLFYQTNRIRLGISGAYDQPNNQPVFPDGWTGPVYSKATLVSPFLDVLLVRGWTVTLQRLQVWGGEVTEQGPLASPTRAPVTNRYPYQEANEVALAVDDKILDRYPASLRLSYTQSDEDDFRLIKAATKLRFGRSWSVQGEMQLVAGGDENSATGNEVTPYINNGQVQGGVGYAF